MTFQRITNALSESLNKSSKSIKIKRSFANDVHWKIEFADRFHLLNDFYPSRIFNIKLKITWRHWWTTPLIYTRNKKNKGTSQSSPSSHNFNKLCMNCEKLRLDLNYIVTVKLAVGVVISNSINRDYP